MKIFDKNSSKVKYIDLFSGLGGTRIGFEQACDSIGINHECVLTSEIKGHAISVYQHNFINSKISGDITKIDPKLIPDFDYLLAGFPCQPFSSAGKRNGFLDHRGGLFFCIHKILNTKKPLGFLLENVDGLATHDNGNTLNIIISKLEDIGYKVSWKILDSSKFGVPQKRKRIYIVGHRNFLPALDEFIYSYKNAGEFIDHNAPVEITPFTKVLSKEFSDDELYGKSIKDKRGGPNNIHSWDLEIKGRVNKEQKKLLELILKKRRYKKWAENKGIDWMDGMPLTIEEIKTFYNHPDLFKNLNDLTDKGYLAFENPKKRVIIDGITKRVPCVEADKGYNIIAGKLSLPLAFIIDPNDAIPTIVATEVGKIGVVTKKGIRPITVQEGLDFSGFPSYYEMVEKDYAKAFDLIGNTVMPPVIKEVVLKILKGHAL